MMKRDEVYLLLVVCAGFFLAAFLFVLLTRVT